MAKKVKDSGKTRRAGKDIVPRLKVVEGVSFILVATSSSKAMKTALLWAPQPPEPDKPFLFVFDLPDGKGDTMMVSIGMAYDQAQAVYAGHPRRVPHSELPPECPLEEVVDPPRKGKGKGEATSGEGTPAE